MTGCVQTYTQQREQLVKVSLIIFGISDKHTLRTEGWFILHRTTSTTNHCVRYSGITALLISVGPLHPPSTEWCLARARVFVTGGHLVVSDRHALRRNRTRRNKTSKRLAKRLLQTGCAPIAVRTQFGDGYHYFGSHMVSSELETQIKV